MQSIRLRHTIKVIVAATFFVATSLQAAPGEFTDSGQALDAVPLTPNCSTPTNCFDFSLEAVLSDLDADGDLDAVVLNAFHQSGPTGIWLNDGTGVFTEGLAFGPEGMDMDIGDLDDDGDDDVLFINNGFDSEVWLNDGTGVFSNAQIFPTVCSAACQVELSDLDGDGDLDAFMGGGAGSQVFLNNGNGLFAFTGQSLIAGRYLSLADMDGDGDMDAYSSTGSVGTLLINDGLGGFTSTGQSGLDGGVVDLGDVDGDGDNDVLLGRVNGSFAKIWLNDGIGSLTDTSQTIVATSSTEVILEDLDADGDLDAFILESGGSSRVLTNNGIGVFTVSQSLATGGLGMGLGDVNGDGSIDVFVARGRRANQVWLNDAPSIEFPTKTLTSDFWEQISLPGPVAMELTVGDVFGDELEPLDYGSNWILFRYNPESSLYEDVGINGVLGQGIGYWMVQITGADVQISIPAGSGNTLSNTATDCGSPRCFSAPLDFQSGPVTWNMLGYPYAISQVADTVQVSTQFGDCIDGCDIVEANENNLIGQQLWHYNPEINAYDALVGSAIVNAWDGVWVAALPGSGNVVNGQTNLTFGGL